MDETDWDDLFRALGDVHRRRLLFQLRADDAGREPIQIPEDVSDGERDLASLQVEMFHTHMPMLAEAGYVHWNREEHEAVEGPTFDEIEPVLDLLHSHREDLPGDMI